MPGDVLEVGADRPAPRLRADAGRARARTRASNRRPSAAIVDGARTGIVRTVGAPTTTPPTDRPPRPCRRRSRGARRRAGSNCAPAAIGLLQQRPIEIAPQQRAAVEAAGYRPSTRRRAAPVTRMPSTRRPRASIAAADAERVAARASVPGFTVSPHSLSRGKRARSMSRTRAPARASTIAAIAPAGPAPTIRSTSVGSGHRRAPEDSALFFDPNPRQLHSAASTSRRAAVVGDEVQVARRIRIVQVDRRRQEPARHRQRGGHDAGRAAGALRMADHRLDRRSGEPIGVRAEHLRARSATRRRRSAASTCRGS